MGIDSFKTEDTDTPYTEEEIYEQLEEIAEEYGYIDTSLIDAEAEFHYMTICKRYGDGTLKSALDNLGFSRYASIKKDEYSEDDILSAIEDFYNNYGYFTIREFINNPFYPSRTPIEDKFGSFEEAISELEINIDSHKGYKHRHEMVKRLILDELGSYYDYTNSFTEVPINSDELSNNRIADIILTSGGSAVSVVEIKATFSDYNRNIENQLNDFSKLDCRVCLVTFKEIFNSYRGIKRKLIEMESLDILLLSDVQIEPIEGGIFTVGDIKGYKVRKY